MSAVRLTLPARARTLGLCVMAAGWAVLAVAARAQAPDSLAGPPIGLTPADSLAPAPVPAAAPGAMRRAARPPGVLPGPAPGRVATVLPPLAPALSAERLLAAAPGAFGYALGAPGRWGGVAFDGLDPAAPALLLGGLPYDDLLDGRPRYDLLPLAALDRLRFADARLGRPLAAEATLRPFRLARPVTELRYRAGQAGVQAASGTHAQTRRAPALLGGAAGRLTYTGYAETTRTNGNYAGGRLRQTTAFGRLALTRPGLGAELLAVTSARTEGARLGVRALPGDPASLFDPFRALVAEPEAERRTERYAVALTLARPPATPEAEPLVAGAYWTRQRLAYTRGITAGADTLATRADRLGLRLDAPLGRRRVRADAFWDAPAAGSVVPAGARAQAYAALLDSLALGPARLALEAGAGLVGTAPAPAFAARLVRGEASLGVRYAALPPPRLAAAGWRGPQPVSAGEAPLAPALAADATLGAALGADVRVRLRVAAHLARGPYLVARGDTAFAYERLGAARPALAAEARLGWRPAAAAGPYGALALAGAGVAHGGDALARRLDDALPRARASLRVGRRGRGLRGGTLDYDLYADAEAWTVFRSRRLHTPTGALALPDPALAPRLPARGTLALHAEATLERRATLFVRAENVLARRLYPGAILVPGEPLAAHPIRFGVFWVLLD